MRGSRSAKLKSPEPTRRARRLALYIADAKLLAELPTTTRRQRALVLDAYPFDDQLLRLSRLYRASRHMYLRSGGRHTPSLYSTSRSLSRNDLFANDLEYAPARAEVMWFKDHFHELAPADAEAEAEALIRFNDISLFHEQNHRLIWNLLPPAPSDKAHLCRYLNFAESLAITLDVALADEAGELSTPLQRMNLLYRRESENRWRERSRAEYRRYLVSVTYATYCMLELVAADDLDKALDYVFPGQRRINRDAVACSLTLHEPFAMGTNPRWQARHWESAAAQLARLHAKSTARPLHLPADPLDVGAELRHVKHILARFGL